MSAHSHSEQEFLNRLSEIVQTNLANEKFGVSELARKMGMSRSNLHFKVKSATKISASGFIRRERLKRALGLLRESTFSVSEIAYKVGFGSATYFSKCFHDYYGYPPGEAEKRYLIEKNSVNIPEQKKYDGLKKKRFFFVSILFAVLISTAVFVVLNSTSIKKNNYGNSIALLPLEDFSKEKDHEFNINRLENQIISKLFRIENLKVAPHSSVKLYKNSEKENRVIGDELMVSYILQGDITIVGNMMSIYLELIEAASGNLLYPYSNKISIDNIDKIFDIQEKIALDIAEYLDIPLTQKEEEKIASLPSENSAALYKYNMALSYLDVKEHLKPKKLLEEAVELDSTFADAYALLGQIYIYILSNRFSPYLKNSYLDSGMVVIEKALYYDAKHLRANNLKYAFYLIKGMSEKAKEMEPMFDRLIKNKAYYHARFYHYSMIEDYYNAINAFYKYMELKPKTELIDINMLIKVSRCFEYIGFPELAKLYTKEKLEQINDSLAYYMDMARIEYESENFQESLNVHLKGHQLDSTRRGFIFGITGSYIYLGDYEKAYQYSIKLDENVKEIPLTSRTPIAPFIGLICFKMGKQKEAEYYLKEAEQYYKELLEINATVPLKAYDFFLLSWIYATLGDSENALKYLKMFEDMEVIQINYVLNLKIWPGFDNIRNEAEFKKILKNAEKIYQQKHKRVKKLLVKKGILES